MTERRELEASLAEMDRKLRELQRELAGLSPDLDAAGAARHPAPPQPDEARIAELGRRVDQLAVLCTDVQHATRLLREELGGDTGHPGSQ